MSSLDSPRVLRVLKPDQLRRLRLVGIEEIDELVATARVAGPELSRFLQQDVQGALREMNLPDMAFELAAPDGAFDEPFALGVSLEHIPRETEAFAYAVAEDGGGPPTSSPLPATAGNTGPPPPSVTLIPQMPPIRDQARRGTCVAFSAIATLEHWRHSAAIPPDYSEQYLYWDCKQNDGIPTVEGTWLGIAFPLLQRDGVCFEGTWPYFPNPVPGNIGQGPPPTNAAIEAPAQRVSGFNRLPPTVVPDLKAELARGRCVSFSVPVFSWSSNPSVILTGKINLPLPGEPVRGGHAMTLVGYRDSVGDPGGGRFILRNSWGTRWASQSPDGPGYGTIPYDYLARYGKEAYSLP